MVGVFFLEFDGAGLLAQSMEFFSAILKFILHFHVILIISIGQDSGIVRKAFLKFLKSLIPLTPILSSNQLFCNPFLEIMEPYIFLSQIRPGDRDWTAKVLVEDKLNLYVNNRGTKILKLLDTDEKRDKVEVLIWNNDIPALDVRLEPFNTYYIRGPLVRNINPDFSRIAPGITTQWTMRAHNYVKRIEDASLQITYPPIISALFTDVQYFAGKGISLDMVAIVVEVREPRPQESHMIQEFVIINQELKPVQLTMWNDFLKSHGVTLAAMKNQMPIIMCKRLQAGNFWGMPVLSTTPSSFIVIQPAIPEVANLQTWKNKNLDTIRLAHKDYYNHAPTRMPRYMPEKFVSIVQLHSGSSAVRIKGHIIIPNVCQPLAYLSCSSCGSKTSALLRHEFTCNICDAGFLSTL